MVTSKEHYPQTVLLLSDVHIGGKVSAAPEYKANLLEMMARYDHVVMLGDNWELFYIDRKHVDSISGMLEIVSGKDRHEWKKEFEKDEHAKSNVKNVINGAKWFTREFLSKNPKVHLHVVGGNHESVRRFHNDFDQIQKDFPRNFEWSAEAIRLGDGLMTHGHLPMDKTTLERTPIYRLREAGSKEWVTNIIHRFTPQEQRWQERHRGDAAASAMVMSQLQKWNGTDKLAVSRKVDGESFTEPLQLDGIRHVFFGHTHVKFDHYEHAETGMLLHNTGAIVQATEHVGPGILEAKLGEDGALSDIQPVHLAKDKPLYTFPNTSGGRSRD